MNLSLITAEPLAIRVHLFLALLAIALGLSQFWLRKGTWRHKIVGYFFVVFVASLSIASFFIKSLFPALGLGWLFFGFSPLHLLSIYVLYSLGQAMWAIKHGDVKTHERAMKGIFFYGIIVAGIFTLMPGRLLFRVFFGG
ncbi:MAG: DUF2306 domain-containing protein [Hydrotalea sp.]|nr:DUF2306 domain-containing protein [Hydrotalea sp.]